MAINLALQSPSVEIDAGGRRRVSLPRTLFDGKTLNADNPDIWDVKGTGAGSFANNAYSMSVTAGQYLVRQARLFTNYFSGKSQLIEMTFQNFQLETNTTKKIGYFSTSATIPYNTVYDGFWLESDGITGKISLVISRDGIETVRVEQANWLNKSAEIQSYDFSKFTVMLCDFLWLGGAVLNFYLKTASGFVLAHRINWASLNLGIFMLSPNQPIRYEIFSTTGTGSLIAICSQVSTEGGDDNIVSYQRIVNTGTGGISFATAGITYPVIAIRKTNANRNICVVATGFEYLVSSLDRLIITLQKDPIISGAGLVYSPLANSVVEFATGDGVLAVTTAGKIIASKYVTQDAPIPNGVLPYNLLSQLMVGIDNTMSTLVLCATPITGTTTNFASLIFEENRN